MRKAFVTYIRPILECNSILWSPNLVNFIDLIESVKRKFTKRINSLASVPYSNRLNLLNLQPSELRRLHLDLTNYYKILNGLSPLKQMCFTVNCVTLLSCNVRYYALYLVGHP